MEDCYRPFDEAFVLRKQDSLGNDALVAYKIETWFGTYWVDHDEIFFEKMKAHQGMQWFLNCQLEPRPRIRESIDLCLRHHDFLAAKYRARMESERARRDAARAV